MIAVAQRGLEGICPVLYLGIRRFLEEMDFCGILDDFEEKLFYVLCRCI